MSRDTCASSQHFRPLRMSPVNRAGPLTRTNFALGSYGKARFPRWEKAEDPRDEFWREIRKTKTKIDGETQPSYFFYAYHGFGNPFSCITAVKRVANDVENSSGRAKRCHSGRLVAEAKLFVTKVETNKAKMLDGSIRTCWYKPGRTDSWWENIWKGTAPEECWKENFRMSRTSFVNLVAELRPYISPNPTSSTIKRMRCCEEFIPVTGMKCSYGKIFQPAYRDPDWKNRDIGNRARPPSHMNTSKIL